MSYEDLDVNAVGDGIRSYIGAETRWVAEAFAIPASTLLEVPTLLAALLLAVCVAGCAGPTWVKGYTSYDETVNDELECERSAAAKIIGSTPAARSERQAFVDHCSSKGGTSAASWQWISARSTLSTRAHDGAVASRGST